MLKTDETKSTFSNYQSIDGTNIIEYHCDYDGIFIISEGKNVGDEEVIFLSWTNVEDLVELFFKLKVDK